MSISELADLESFPGKPQAVSRFFSSRLQGINVRAELPCTLNLRNDCANTNTSTSWYEERCSQAAPLALQSAPVLASLAHVAPGMFQKAARPNTSNEPPSWTTAEQQQSRKNKKITSQRRSRWENTKSDNGLQLHTHLTSCKEAMLLYSSQKQNVIKLLNKTIGGEYVHPIVYLFFSQILSPHLFSSLVPQGQPTQASTAGIFPNI